MNKPKSFARRAVEFVAAPIVGWALRNIEDPNVPLTLSQFSELLTGGLGPGKPVSVRGSLKIATVWACVEIVSNAVARMPLIMYERTEDGRRRAEEEPLYELLKLRPNDDTSAFSLRKALVANRLLGGRGCCEIVRRRSGQVQELQVIEWDRILPKRVPGGELRYEYRGEDGITQTLLQRDVLYVPGLTFDGITGLSVIGHARLTLSAALSRQEFMAAFYRNGLRPSGVLQHPGELGKKALENLRKSFSERNAGPENAGKPLILEEGMQWNAQGVMISPEDAQFVESEYVTIEDICRWFGVPPHKVQHLLRATNNNIEQMSLDFLGDTLSPITEAIEQEFNWKLFTPNERRRFYVEHLTQAIVQMDAATRGQLYQRLVGIGAMCADDVCQRENMNNIPDKRGKVYYVPVNVMPSMTPDQAEQYLAALIKKGGNASSGSSGPGSDQGGAGGGNDPAKVAAAA